MEITITIEKFSYFLNNYDDESYLDNSVDKENPLYRELEDPVTPLPVNSLLEAERVIVIDDNPLYNRKYDLVNDMPKFFSRPDSPLREITFQNTVRLDKVKIFLNTDLTLNFHQIKPFSLTLGVLNNYYPNRNFHVSLPNIMEMDEIRLFASHPHGDLNRPIFHIPSKSIAVNKKLVIMDVTLVGNTGDVTLIFRSFGQFYTNVELPPKSVLCITRNLGHLLVPISTYHEVGTDLVPFMAEALEYLLFKQMGSLTFLYSTMPLYAQLTRTEKNVNLVLKPTNPTALTRDQLELSENISLRFDYNKIQSDYVITDILVYNDINETVASVTNYKGLYQVGGLITNEDLDRESVSRLYTLPSLPSKSDYMSSKHGFKVFPQVDL